MHVYMLVCLLVSVRMCMQGLHAALIYVPLVLYMYGHVGCNLIAEHLMNSDLIFSFFN